MSTSKDFLNDFHWMMDVLQNIDVGLVILDKQFSIQLWNGFMQNHSAKAPEEVLGNNIFSLFPELPESWFRRKVQSVFFLHNCAFTTWEQRPYLFRFRNYRPITSIADFMYQNSTIIPLVDLTGKVEHICLILYDVTEVAVNRIQLQSANNQLRLLSRTDGLTGLLNRKTWESHLDTEFRRYQRHQHKCSLILFDIDHFKKVNDTFGHPAGDEVIRQTANILLESLRETDIAGRYGGEEFAVILLDTESEDAYAVSERIRKHIEKSISLYENQEITYTISLGIAELSADMADKTAWIETADRCLYQAKDLGRNQSVLFQTNDSDAKQQSG